MWAQTLLGILGGVAFLMAIQPFIQMWCGRPKINIGFSTYDVKDGGGTCMICTIWNKPITKGILSFLRIHRDTAEDVLAFFFITERGTGERIFSPQEAILIKTRAGFRAERISLPASFFPASFIVALVNRKNGQVLLEDKETKLQSGEYIVNVIIDSDGKQYKKTSLLIIEDKYPFATWDTIS